MTEGIDFFTDAQAIAERIICSFDTLSDEQLHEVRRKAKEGGAACWRIECATDAEIIRRAAKHGDKKAIVEQHAAEIGVTSRRVYENAAVSAVVDAYCESAGNRTFPDILTKTDVVESLPTENPIRTLEAIVEQKTAHVSFNAGNNEWYTPEEYILSARSVMGDIDTDPASSNEANKVVKAARFFDAHDNGLLQDWHGRVWMNPPYAAELIGQFATKLVEHFTAGDVTQAIVLVNNATETAWFCRITEVASAVVFPKGRVRFWEPGGKPSSPLQGQALIYLGDRTQEFIEAFGRYGWGAVI